MNYRNLGNTGVKVSPLCLGAMMFGAGQPRPRRRRPVIHRALDAGINFIDTADVYSRGESEEIVGKALAGGKRDNVVLATKVHGTMGDDPNEFGNSRRWIVREVENSLRRLRTDWIDLYQIHRPEDDTDIDETLGALSDLVHAGKVRYIGSSTFPASQIVEAQWVARARPRAVRLRAAALLDPRPRGRERRAPDLPAPRDGRDPLEPARRRLAVRPLRARRGLPSPPRRRMPDRYDLSLPGNQRKLEAADALAQLAEEAGITLIEMALAFVIRHPAVTAAIIGPRTMEQLESQLERRRRRAVRRPARPDRRDRPPGINLNPADGGWQNPALEPSARRR